MLKRSGYVLIILFTFILTGCSGDKAKDALEQSSQEKYNSEMADLNQQINALKEDNQKLKLELDGLVNSNQELLEKQGETDEILNGLKNMYGGAVTYTQRILEVNKGIRALPDLRLDPLRDIGKGTVLEVLAAIHFPGDSGFNTWLFVHAGAGDTPCPEYGWIREEDTAAFTSENQMLAAYPLHIMPGTSDLRSNRLISDTDINESYWLNFYDGDKAQLSGTGGRVFTIPRDRIMFPPINPEDKLTQVYTGVEYKKVQETLDKLMPYYRETLRIFDWGLDAEGEVKDNDGAVYLIVTDNKYKSVEELWKVAQSAFTDKYLEEHYSWAIGGERPKYKEIGGKLCEYAMDSPTPPLQADNYRILRITDSSHLITMRVDTDEGMKDAVVNIKIEDGNWLIDNIEY